MPESQKKETNNADFLAAETKAKQTLKCLGAHMATVTKISARNNKNMDLDPNVDGEGLVVWCSNVY